MFVVLVTYKVPIEVVDQHLKAHRDFLETQYQAGKLLASGPQNPRTGGVILARCKSRAELDALLAADPFSQKDLADYQVIEFTPVKHAQGFERFI